MIIEMALFLPLSMNQCRIFPKKVDFGNAGVSVWGFSTKSLGFWLTRFFRVSKNSVSGGVPVFTFPSEYLRIFFQTSHQLNISLSEFALCEDLLYCFSKNFVKLYGYQNSNVISKRLWLHYYKFHISNNKQGTFCFISAGASECK